MSDQSLREALEKVLATTDGWTVSNETLLGLLRDHPVEPASRLTPEEADRILDQHFAPVRGIAEGGGITEAVIEATCEASEGGWGPAIPAAVRAMVRDRNRRILEAALPLLGLQQVPTVLLDREAVRLAIADELDGEGVVSYGLAPKLTDRVMDVAQQVPSREEIERSLGLTLARIEAQDFSTIADGGNGEPVALGEITDTVLALFSKPAEDAGAES